MSGFRWAGNFACLYPFETELQKVLIDHFDAAEAEHLWSRLKVHYTPKHGSWLNQAEIELSLVSRQCLGKRRIPTVEHCSPKLVPGLAKPIDRKFASNGT